MLDLEWMAILTAFYLQPRWIAAAGYISAHAVITVFFPARIEGIPAGWHLMSLESAFAAGMLASGMLLAHFRTHYRDTPATNIQLLALPGILAVFELVTPTGTTHSSFTWLYAAATIIVSILAILKLKTLKPILPIFFRAWFFGYTMTTALICTLGLNPETVSQPRQCVGIFFLAPYAVYLLELLIISHILIGFSDTTPRTSSGYTGDPPKQTNTTPLHP